MSIEVLELVPTDALVSHEHLFWNLSSVYGKCVGTRWNFSQQRPLLVIVDVIGFLKYSSGSIAC